MKFVTVIIFGLLAVLIAQTMNTVSSLYSKTHYYYVLGFTVICQLLIGLFLIKYYGNGIKYFKFSILAMFYYGMGVIISIIIQYKIFKQPFKPNDLISAVLILTGIFYYYLTKK